MNTVEDRFEDRLLTELARIVTARSAAGSPTPTARRRALRLAGAGAAVIATATVVVSPSTTVPAYAVEANPDGTLTITVHDLTDPRGLQARLARFGVASHVTLDRAIQGHIQRQCHAIPKPSASWQAPGLIVGAGQAGPSHPSTAHANVVTINPAKMPAGATLAVHIGQLLSPTSPHRPIAEALRVAVAPAGTTDPWLATVVPCPTSTATTPSGTQSPGHAS